MAGSRSSGRHVQASHEDRQQRLIFMGVGAVLAVVAVVVVVGLILTWFLPPRAHVLTVGEREFNAREMADRAFYLAITGSPDAQRNPADAATESYIAQEILLQVGASRVAEVTEEDVRESIAERLELAEGYTDEQYVEALQGFLQVAPVTRSELEEIVRAGIIEDRIGEQLGVDIPEAGEQMQVMAVGMPSPALAQSLIAAVGDGQDFREAAVELGIVESEDAVTDLGWFAPATLPERIQPQIADLQAGEVSDPIDSTDRIGFEVYFIAERTADEPYEESVREQLIDDALAAWMDEQEALMAVETNLTSSNRDWILGQVQEALRG